MNKRNKAMKSGLALSILAQAFTYAEVSVAEQSGDVLSPIEVKAVVPTTKSTIDGPGSSVTKMDVSLKDTSRSAVNLSEEKLEQIGAKDVSEAFDYVSSFQRRGSSDRRFTARGLSTTIDNVMVDGLRTLQGGEAGSGSRFPSTYNAESVTFLRGGDGILYGAGIGGGMINVQTKKPQEESETIIGMGYRTYISEDTKYFDRNGFNMTLSSTGKVTDDANVLYMVNLERSPNMEMYQDLRIQDETFFDAALTFKLGKTEITPKYEYGYQSRTGGAGYGDGLIRPNDREDSSNRQHYYGSKNDFGENTYTQTSVSIKHQLNNDWKIRTVLRYNETKSDTEDLYVSTRSNENNIPTLVNGNYVMGRKWVRSRGRDAYTALDTNIEGFFDIGKTEHHLVAGINYLNTEVKFYRGFQDSSVIQDALSGTGGSPISVNDPSSYSVDGTPPAWDIQWGRQSEVQNINVYLRDRISAGDFTFIAGLAYINQDAKQIRKGNTYENSESGFVYDLGTIYAVNDAINVFVNYSRTYDPLQPRHTETSGAGQDFEPIKGHNYELGVKGGFFNNRVTAGATIFSLTRENNARSIDDDNGVSVLRQDSGKNFESVGLELDAAIRATDKWNASVSYAYTDAKQMMVVRNSPIQKWVDASLSPKHSLAIWNGYQLTNEFSANLGIRYSSETTDYGWRLDSNGNANIRNKFKASTEIDLGAAYEVNNWSSRLVIKNVLDDSRIIGGRNVYGLKANTPRSLHATVNYKF